ncbi:ABC transporter substrate-binding protein [Chitinivibrio alkaliphilus]|uniref:ABC-type transport system, substrat-binding component n=1 Tax=Chitinivibrio alkaliphilus ACht1 TaxID=1313304 RepID=U7D6L8_9BACT|nr:ABC transporter substrate-binding protein [Chitinivibrio alkaliphilus]ERP31583.1 ABC-type transport system, substrat-binding component [Chitinivibrio alkaliphilus ACht1]
MKYGKTVILSLLALSLFTLFSGCGPRKEKEEITVLIRMLDAQKRFFENEIVPRFEDRYNVKVNIADFRNAADLRRILELDQNRNEISLVKAPFEITQQLVEEGYIHRLSDIETDPAYLEQDMRVYHPLAKELGTQKGNYYYIPRKLETRILFYRKSKVEDAYSKFDDYRAEIDSVLQEANGFGLPREYELSKDPSDWDFYDLFTVGYIWANEEYYGRRTGRIAHRGDRYEGTALFFVDRAYQLGATRDDIISMSGDAVDETYLWEKVFIDMGIYNPGIWNNRWRGNDIYTGIQDGNVFLAYMQQIDCFNIHGWEEDPGMQSFLEDPSDMGVAVVPKGVSFTLNEDGTPRFEGSRRITVGGWWWGVPTSSPNADMGYQLAKFITNRGVHVNESAQFGMIPVRRDILFNIAETYDMGWVGDIYRTSIEQLQFQITDSITTVPRIREYSDIGYTYIDAWNSFIDGANQNVGYTAENIREALNDGYVQRIEALFEE